MIRDLDLANNNFGDKCKKKLFNSINKNQTIKNISLWNTGITNIGASFISD